MTRILSLLLTLLMLLGTFTACQNKKPQEKAETPPQTEPSTELPEEPAMSEAQALYEKAMALAAGGYYLEQKVTVTTPENPDYILDVLKTKVTKNGGNCTVYSGTMDNFKEMTYVDGTLYAYTKTIGWNDIIKKYKKQCSLEKALAEMEFTYSNLPSFPLELFADAEIVSESGLSCIMLVLDGKEYADLLKGFVGLFERDADSFGNFSAALFFDHKGTAVEIFLAFTATDGGETVLYQVDYLFANVGDAPEIEVPKDASSYK